ncbi:helix-turn-helix domain-containing protein [Nocardia sp. NPDC127526]|uniref:helix-turn-helix domain-containing protein n=1 Tax=Nocardia sp. NPDC127526 TaxID=3345393 RepID=UPI00363E6408
MTSGTAHRTAAGEAALPAQPGDGGGGLLRRRMATKEFTMISNKLARDKNLSNAAKGLFVQMASHTEGFRITLDGLARNCADGVTAVRSALKELELHGYVRRLPRVRDAKGHLGPYGYEITDIPEPPRLAVVLDPARRHSSPGLGTETEETPRSHPASGSPTLVEPTEVDLTTKKTKMKKTDQVPCVPPPDTPGARLLRGLGLRHPITESTVARYAARVDNLLITWTAEALTEYLEMECNAPTVRKPIGRLVDVLRDIRPRAPRTRAARGTSSSSRTPCGTCVDPKIPGWIAISPDSTTVRRCPKCNPTAQAG